LINTFINCLSFEAIPRSYCIVASSESHVTKELTRWKLNSYLPNTPSNFQFVFFDCWGLTNENYAKGVTPFLNGEIQEGIKMENLEPKPKSVARRSVALLRGLIPSASPNPEPQMEGNTDPGEDAQTPEQSTQEPEQDIKKTGTNDSKAPESEKVPILKRHVFVILVPQGLQKAEQELLMKLSDHADTARSLGYTPIVVVTQIDLSTGLDMKALQQFIQHWTGVDSSDIYYHRNYDGTLKRRNTDIDFSARAILLAIFRRAQEFKSNQSNRERLMKVNFVLEESETAVKVWKAVSMRKRLPFQNEIKESLKVSNLPTDEKFSLKIVRRLTQQRVGISASELQKDVEDILNIGDGILILPESEDTTSSDGKVIAFYKAEEGWQVTFEEAKVTFFRRKKTEKETPKT